MALYVERSRLYKRGRPPGRYPAHCSAEFGLSSVLQQRPSGPAANNFIIVHADYAGRQSRDGVFPYSLGARTNAYTSRATPINTGISPAR